MSENWTTIESDPAVFTELLHDIGVQGIEVIELYDIQQTTHIAQQYNNSVLGLIFLFKYDSKHYADTASNRAVLDDDDDMSNDIFFAKQTINNACGTQALINILMNVDINNNNDVQLGDELSSYKSFAVALDPESRGYAINASERIRLSHNSYARPEPFIFDDNDNQRNKRDKTEDLFHFIGYIPHNGLIYELDGLQRGPILVGAYDSDNQASWLNTVNDVIQERINTYTHSSDNNQQTEIRFNLMAVVKSQKDILEKQLHDINQQIQDMQSNNNMNVYNNDNNNNNVTLNELQNKKYDMTDKLNDENNKYKQYKQDNIRRRHNFVALIYNLTYELAKRNKLTELVDLAKQKTKQRIEKQQSRNNALKEPPAAPRKQNTQEQKEQNDNTQ